MTTKKRPRLMFVFAHPDDDVFGPAGSLIKMARDYDIYFVCATRGEQGQNVLKGKHPSIEHIRESEARASSRVIGAKDIHFLGFKDGALSNNLYHQISDEIERLILKYQPEVLMTWEPQGVTGHVDHIVMSLVCHYIFYRSSCIKRLMLYCLSEYQTVQFLENYFIYRPPGYKRRDIDLVYDISDVWDKKIEAIECHKSQIGDMHKILSRPKVRMMEDCFIVKIK